MGAAELYITLLSVCERLLKVLKSVALTRAQNFPHFTAPDKRGAAALVRAAGGRGDDTQMDRLLWENN